MNKNLEKQSLIWGVLLIVFGVATLMENFFRLNPWTWVGILIGAGIFVAVVYWPKRSNWAYFIPSYIFWAIAGLVALALTHVLLGEGIAAYVLVSIALPFIIGYLRNRDLWGLLIPAYTLIAVGIMVAFIGIRWLDDLLIPAYVMFAVALPFLVVYIRNTKNWWALIPGGIMSVIGLGFLLATPSVRFVIPAILVFIGIVILVRQFIPSKN